MDKALALWEQGMHMLRSLHSQVSDVHRAEYQREVDMAAYLQSCFRSVVNGNRFFALRRQYRELTKDQASIEANRDRAVELLDRMRAIIEAELINSRQGLIIARREHSLDLAVRLDMDYPPLTKIIEAKIAFTEKVLKEQLPAERRRIGSQ